MSSTIHLNFINNSNDKNNSDIVIFQKNAVTDFSELAVAWQVIKYCGQGWNHPLKYPIDCFVGASDSWGNYSPLKQASPGQSFAMKMDPTGDQLVYNGPASSPTEYQILNELPQGSINANIYKDGKLFAVKTGIAPNQKAVFEFKPSIWIGVVSQIDEGDVMNSAIISQINTEISLLGIASADIVMSGGGPGPSSTPFVFTLENIVYA